MDSQIITDLQAVTDLQGEVTNSQETLIDIQEVIISQETLIDTQEVIISQEIINPQTLFAALKNCIINYNKKYSEYAKEYYTENSNKIEHSTKMYKKHYCSFLKEKMNKNALYNINNDLSQLKYLFDSDIGNFVNNKIKISLEENNKNYLETVEHIEKWHRQRYQEIIDGDIQLYDKFDKFESMFGSCTPEQCKQFLCWIDEFNNLPY